MTTKGGIQPRMPRSDKQQGGFSLIGFLCTLTVFGTIGVLLVRAGPSVVEYWAIDKAVAAASLAAQSPDELRNTFDKLAAAGSIDSIEGKDLKITGTGKEMEISFAYEKKIPLFGPASLLIDYRGGSVHAFPEKVSN
jgi:type II secretory pathway pseudopilin PulG